MNSISYSFASSQCVTFNVLVVSVAALAAYSHLFTIYHFVGNYIYATRASHVSCITASRYFLKTEPDLDGPRLLHL